MQRDSWQARMISTAKRAFRGRFLVDVKLFFSALGRLSLEVFHG